jgi:tRNA(fMet)-specific endonuclease VapC
MKFMLDTNACIAAINGDSDKLVKNITKREPNQICVSSITLAELSFGIANSTHKQRNVEALEKFLSTIEIASFNAKAAYAYGDLRAELKKGGILIGPLDMLIAAHALALNVTLVTDNVREFERITKLSIANWLR